MNGSVYVLAVREGTPEEGYRTVIMHGTQCASRAAANMLAFDRKANGEGFADEFVVKVPTHIFSPAQLRGIRQ